MKYSTLQRYKNVSHLKSTNGYVEICTKLISEIILHP